jgi:adenosylcobinamide kinase / adenosylcobinamide-phosphate guanylyltransferase
MTDANHTLILGGVRSGKSRLAEQRAANSCLEVIYVATAQALDDTEMRARIDTHRARRLENWTTIEAPIRLADTLRAHCAPDRCVLVDCLTLWLTNLLCANDAGLLAVQCDALLTALPTLPGRIILVSNETGLGVVPMGALTRRYVDAAGELHQRLAEVCSNVIMTVAGLPMVLKGQ